MTEHRMAGSLPWRRAGQLLAVALLIVLVGLPLAELLSTAADQGVAWARRAAGARGLSDATVNTLWTAAAVTVLAGTAGAIAAWITERGAVPGRRWLRIGVLVPLIVPPFVSALSWARAYGPAGLTDDVLGLALPGTYGPAGVVIVLAVHAMPLAYLPIAASLRSRAEPDTERAARASGATGLQAVRTVTLPLLRPAMAAAAALVFVTTTNAFGVPAILGTPAGFVTMTTRIYQDLVFAADPRSFTRALILACLLLVLTVGIVAAADLLTRSTRRLTRTGQPVGAPAMARPTAWGPAAGLWIYLVLTTGVPLVALVLTALTRAVGLSPVPGNWTLANFRDALAGPGADAFANSVLLALAAATTVVILGGLLTALRRGRFGRSLGTSALVTFAMPGSAVAVAVLLAYGPLLRDTLLLILVAYLAKFWALGHRPIAGAAEGVPPELHRAARASGAGGSTTLWTVVIPLLRPAIAAAWVLVFLFAFHELAMSALLYGPGSETLAVSVLNLQQLGDVTVTAALAVLLTLVVLAGAAPLLRLPHSAPRGRAGP